MKFIPIGEKLLQVRFERVTPKKRARARTHTHSTAVTNTTSHRLTILVFSFVYDRLQGLPVKLTAPNTSHEDSDDCGAIILGMQEERPNWDMIGAKMNAIRTQSLLKEADIVVVRFGDKYRQWNAAMDAGYASALGKPLIVLHPPSISHMLKEVNAAANVVCEEPTQVVDTLAYVIRGELPSVPKDGDSFVPIAERLGKGNPNP